METEQENSKEPEDTLPEQETLQIRYEAMEREYRAREAVISRLEQTRAENEGEMAALQARLEEAERQQEATTNNLAQAVAAYKELVTQTNPGVFAELITGETAAEVNESLKSAKTLVERIRQELEGEITKARVPAGAPQRVPMDTSTLSPREKIQYGIGNS